MDETAFRRKAESEGFSEFVERDVDAAYALEIHDHPFDARLLMLNGEMTIGTRDGATKTYREGEICDLPRGTSHTESFTAGAKVLVARRR